MRVAGVDGTKNGWVAVALDDGRFAEDILISPIESSFTELHNAEVVAIDFPIGFGPVQPTGQRESS
jgi:predicted RNase H-like nuclease